jgi:hypothetical protein
MNIEAIRTEAAKFAFECGANVDLIQEIQSCQDVYELRKLAQLIIRECKVPDTMHKGLDSKRLVNHILTQLLLLEGENRTIFVPINTKVVDGKVINFIAPTLETVQEALINSLQTIPVLPTGSFYEFSDAIREARSIINSENHLRLFILKTPNEIFYVKRPPYDTNDNPIGVLWKDGHLTNL